LAILQAVSFALRQGPTVEATGQRDHRQSTVKGGLRVDRPVLFALAARRCTTAFDPVANLLRRHDLA